MNAIHRKKRILAISSPGGHWIQLRRLAPAFEGHHVVWASGDPTLRVGVGEGAYVTFTDANRCQKLRLIRCAVRILWILVVARADVVISTGAAPGAFALRFAKMLRKRTIWVDSIANADELSMSGRLVAGYADLWLTQWEHLARPEGPLYKGSVL